MLNKRVFLVLMLFYAHVGAPDSLAEQSVASKFLEAVLALENPSILYDGGYQRIEYPLGDVPADRGVCTDVIIRAYRAIGIDLQKLVHEDMKQNFAAYPQLWGLTRPDSHIDHRRVPNLIVFFKRHGKTLALSRDSDDYKAGNIVTWNLRNTGSLPHIGIVTDRRCESSQRPLIMHNIGGGQVLEDILFNYRITGHFRYGLD